VTSWPPSGSHGAERLGRFDRPSLTANRKPDRTVRPKPESALTEYVAPRNEVEGALCDIFAEVLGFDRVGIEDDFFALGGDSLSTVRVAQQGQRFGFEIQPLHVFHWPTPLLLAMNITMHPEPSGAGLQSPGLVTLSAQRHLSTPTFVFASTLSGSATPYLPLVRRLPGCSMGLVAPGLWPAESPATSIQGLASYFRDCLEGLPTRSLALIGWSFGAPVAYELGCLLPEAHSIFLVDPLLPNARAIDPENVLGYWRWLFGQYGVDVAQEDLAGHPTGLPDRMVELWPAPGFLVNSSVDAKRRFMLLHKAHRLAMSTYTPTRSSRRIHLILAGVTSPRFNIADTVARWHALADVGGTVVLDAAHADLLEEPGVAGVAQFILSRL